MDNGKWEYLKGQSIQDVPLHLVGQMLNLWEDKWVNETENENWHELTLSWQQISPNEYFLWKWIHVISELVINNYSGIDRYIWCEILLAKLFGPLKIDTCFVKNLKTLIYKETMKEWKNIHVP
jgi:hypothetical protein